VSKAMMLHPLMAKFQIKEGRFSPDNDSIKTENDKLQKFEEKRKEILSERDKLQKLIEKSDQELSSALSSLNVKFNAQKNKESSPESANNKYNEEKNSIENKYWVQRRELQVKMSDLDNELQKVNRENELLHLTSEEETARIFKVILDDVYEAVDVVAKHYNVDFVFNSSFSVERTPVNPSFTPVNPMGQFFAAKFTRDAGETLHKHGEDGAAPLLMTLSYWTACQRWAFRNTVDPRLDQMVIKGGLDMTPAVIDFVYQKYKVPTSHRDVIQEFLKVTNDSGL
ncbi:MAG: hypothetical protein AB1403_17145, partial [Candidatus Riflebacteria bacterium]